MAKTRSGEIALITMWVPTEFFCKDRYEKATYPLNMTAPGIIRSSGKPFDRNTCSLSHNTSPRDVVKQQKLVNVKLGIPNSEYKILVTKSAVSEQIVLKSILKIKRSLQSQVIIRNVMDKTYSLIHLYTNAAARPLGDAHCCWIEKHSNLGPVSVVLFLPVLFLLLARKTFQAGTSVSNIVSSSFVPVKRMLPRSARFSWE